MTIPLAEAYKLAGLAAQVKVAGADLSEPDKLRYAYVDALVKNASTEDLDKHIRFWNIKDWAETARTKIAAWKPAEVPATAFLLPKIQKFAAYDAASLIQASVAFYENRHRFPLDMRKTAAVTALAKAEKFGTMLPEYVDTYLHKAAGLAYPTVESIQRVMIERTNHTPAEYSEYLTKMSEALAAMIDNTDARLDSTTVKVAVDLLDKLDQETGLFAKYGAAVSLPEELLDDRLACNQLQKFAGCETGVVKLVNGQVVEIASLTKSALAAVDPALADMSNAALRDVLPTLPRPDADLLTRLL